MISALMAQHHPAAGPLSSWKPALTARHGLACWTGLLWPDTRLPNTTPYFPAHYCLSFWCPCLPLPAHTSPGRAVLAEYFPDSSGYVTAPCSVAHCPIRTQASTSYPIRARTTPRPWLISSRGRERCTSYFLSASVNFNPCLEGSRGQGPGRHKGGDGS